MPFVAMDCFDWRTMENLPDPHDQVFIRHSRGHGKPDGVIKCQWHGGILFVPTNGTLVRIFCKAMAWAPETDPDTKTKGDIPCRR